MIWIVVTPLLLALGAAVGYLMCSFGTWNRVHQQESTIRALVVDIQVLMDMDDEVPPEWMVARLESMLAKDYR